MIIATASASRKYLFVGIVCNKVHYEQLLEYSENSAISEHKMLTFNLIHNPNLKHITVIASSLKHKYNV